MDNGIEKLRDLIDKYWDAAWREGRENRMHDDEAGTAMAVRHEIESILSSIEQGCCGEQSAESDRQQGLSGTGEMQSGAKEGGEAVAWRCTEKHSNISDVVGAVDAMETYKRFGRKVEPLYTHPSVSVPEGYVLVEKVITPVHVVEAGVDCLSALKAAHVVEPRTVAALVFQDMLLAYEEEEANG